MKTHLTRREQRGQKAPWWEAGITAEARPSTARISRATISRHHVSVAVGRSARGRELDLVRATLIARSQLVDDLDHSWHGQIGHGDNNHPRYRFTLHNWSRTETRTVTVEYTLVRKFTKQIPVKGLITTRNHRTTS